jgi:hypothetical protein
MGGWHHGVGASLVDGFLHDFVISFLVVSWIILADYIQQGTLLFE